jgi:putative FmdB family regulatory protein
MCSIISAEVYVIRGRFEVPIYEFYCSDCRDKFEVLTSYEASQAEMVCASCHGTNVRKLLSVFARPARSGGGDDYGDAGDYGDGEDFGGGGGCACGGACSCNN